MTDRPKTTKAAPTKKVGRETSANSPPKKARHRKAAAPSDPASAAASGPAGKLGIVVELMRRPDGATIAQMSEATGWQAHSLRGAIAGALKKKHGLAIISEPNESGRIYRFASEQPA